MYFGETVCYGVTKVYFDVTKCVMAIKCVVMLLSVLM